MSRMTKSERIQLWLDRLNRHSASQLTVADFCQLEQVSLPSFYQWKRRLSPRVDSATKRRQAVGPSSLDLSRQLPTSQASPNWCQARRSQPPCFASGRDHDFPGHQPEIASLIVDRLLQHARQADRPTRASSC